MQKKDGKIPNVWEFAAGCVWGEWGEFGVNRYAKLSNKIKKYRGYMTEIK